MSLKEVWGDVSGYETYGFDVETTLKVLDDEDNTLKNNGSSDGSSEETSSSAYSVEIRKYAPRVAACSTAPKPFMILAGYIGVGSAPKNHRKKVVDSSGSSAEEGGGKNEVIAMTTPVVMSNPEPIAMTTPVVMSNPPSFSKEAETAGAVESGEGAALTKTTAVDDGHNTRTFKNQHQEMAFMLPAKYSKVEDCPIPDDSRIYLKQVPAMYKACHRYSPSFWVGDSYEQEAKKLQETLSKRGIKMIGDVERHGFNPPYTLFNKRSDVCLNIEWPPTTAESKE